MDVNLPRDKETGKTKGFGFVMYEDQRSTILAVDNLNGAKVLERTLRVDHVRDYKQPKVQNEDGELVDAEEPSLNAKPQLIVDGIYRFSPPVDCFMLNTTQMAENTLILLNPLVQILTPKTLCGTSSLPSGRKNAQQRKLRRKGTNKNTKMQPRRSVRRERRGRRKRKSKSTNLRVSGQWKTCSALSLTVKQMAGRE
jgi:RNA-binding motif X-linked protein 2